MTEIEFLKKKIKLTSANPETKISKSDSLDNYGVKELLSLLRKRNAERKRGEFNSQLKEWILANEKLYCKAICNTIDLSPHRAMFAYYGMVFNILKYLGCFIMGKTPNSISMSKFCKILQLYDRISQHSEKTITGNTLYNYNYMVNIERRANGDNVPAYNKDNIKLEKIASQINDEITKLFL